MRIVRGDGLEAVDDAGFSHIELPLTLSCPTGILSPRERM